MLVPIKTRTPRFEQDGATGYVNLCAITGVEPLKDPTGPSPYSCLIRLKGGQAIKALYSEASVEKRIQVGRRALDEHNKLHQRPLIPVALLNPNDLTSPLAKATAVSQLIYELLTHRLEQSCCCESESSYK